MATDIPEYFERIFESHVSDAGFVLQMAVLGLSKAHYDSKMILDIGSGQTNRFANEANEHINGATVISVNPLLGFEEQCEKHEIDKEAHKLSVAALAQGQLPFMEASFDTVVSVLGVPNSLTSDELPAFFNDVWRILKPGGTASFWPHVHNQTGTVVLVEDGFITTEKVNPRVLRLLPEPYSGLHHRVQITKPESPNLPHTIARTE